MAAPLSSSGPALDSIISLFTSDKSQGLHERHIVAIERLCADGEGFALQDLPKCQKILELTIALIGQEDGAGALFIEPAIKLVRALGRPFVKKAATDEVKLLGNASDVMLALGRLFEILTASSASVKPLKIAATETLRSFATAHGPRPNVLEMRATIPETDIGSGQRQYLTNQMLISRSGVCSHVVKGLASAICNGDIELCLSLLTTILSFSFTASNCEQLASGGLIACLPSLLSVGYQVEMTALTIDIFWNLLENAPEASNRAIASPHGESLSSLAGIISNGEEDASIPPLSLQLAVSLSTLFKDVLGQGFREVDKELRNNVLVVLSLLLDSTSVESSASLYEFAMGCKDAGLFDASLAVASSPESGSDGTPYARPWALTTEELDLEAKLLTWNIIVSSAVILGEPVVESIEGSGLMQTLLTYVRASLPLPSCVERWNSDRRANLRSSALASLHRLAPLLSACFLKSEGATAVLSVISAATGSDMSGNSYVSVTGSQVEAALRQLTALCSLGGPDVAEALGAAGAIPIVLDLIKKWRQTGPKMTVQPRHQGTVTLAGGPLMPEDASSQKACALMLLSAMCSIHPGTDVPQNDNWRRLRKAEGIAVLIQELESLQQLDPTLPSQLALACFGAVWACIVPDRKNAARFLVSEGMDHALDAIEHGHPSHRPVILSLLCDLVENPRALPFFHEWRSAINQLPAASHLIRIWKEEDTLRGLTQDGILANTISPLKGMDKRTRWIPPESIAYGNSLPHRRAQLQAVSDACSSDQLLAKIYALLKMAGMSTISSYVSLEDQSSLCLIEKFTKFKQGEVWRQIKNELEAEGVRPTAPDRLRLVSGLSLAESLAEAVALAQKSIRDQHMTAIANQEAKFFGDAMAQTKYETEMKFFGLEKDKSRLTLGEIRDAKAKRAEMLARSLKEATVLSATGGGSLEASLRDINISA